MGYGISLSGLMSAQEAIDVTSNNIANAQTIGYKTGEYVFADQFFRAQDPQNKDRAGMGAYRQGIRRNDNYGTIVNSQNSLDMAITGKGLFIVAKTIDGTTPTENPTKFQYTRNGQFGVDSDGRVVNQSGMYLVGYAADSSGTVNYGAKSVLTLDPTETLAQKATQNSTINLNLDDRVTPIVGTAFSPTKPTTYSQSTSQTVYDSNGESHTLSMYYKKVNSADLVISGSSGGTTFTFDPTQSLGSAMKGEQSNKIATTAVPSTVSGTEQSIYEATLNYVSGGRESTTGISSLEITDTGDGYIDGVYRDVALNPLSGGASVVDETSSAGGVTYAAQIFDTDANFPNYDNDGIFYNVPVSTTTGNGSGAYATVKVVDGLVTLFKITTKGTGFLPGDDLTISDADAYDAGMNDSESALPNTYSTNVLGFSAGTNYRDGTYLVDLDSDNASASGAQATIEITDGEVSAFTISIAGTGYQAGDKLYVADGATWTPTDGGTALTSIQTATISIATDGTDSDQEVATITFDDLAEGETVTLGGLTFTAGASGASSADVANAFRDATSLTDPLVGVLTGTLSTDWVVSGIAGADNLLFTAAADGPIEDIMHQFQTVATKVKTNGNSATGTVVVQNGAVTSITVNEGGIGYAENDVICFAASDVGGSVASICKATVAGLLSPDSTDTESSGVDVVNTNLSSSLFEPGDGYESDGTFYNVPLSTDGSGSGAYATIVIDGGTVSTVTITTAGTGYSIGDSLYVSDTDAQSAGMDSGTPDTAFSTVVSSLIATGKDMQGSTYTLTLSDGTVLSVKQRSDSASGDYTYLTNADRFAVFAALDGNAVGSDASASSPVTISIGGEDVNEQISLGTMAFVNGKNIDSLARDVFNTPQFVSNLKIDASGGEGTGYGETSNGGIVQLTMDSTNMTGYSSTAMTYDNSQDGHATAYIAGYSVDAYGKLVATFDNGTQLVKGRVALAYFNNFEGLIPTGDNLFAASTSSGDAQTGEYANEGVLGAIRSKALESSNVDLTSELVRLMILQRHYSAVSQATKVQAATIIDDALNIGR
jgi:flagellar hook-basal body protein